MEDLCLEAISHQFFLVEARILRNSFRLFSGQDLTMELLRSFALDVRIHLGGSRG